MARGYRLRLLPHPAAQETTSLPENQAAFGERHAPAEKTTYGKTAGERRRGDEGGGRVPASPRGGQGLLEQYHQSDGQGPERAERAHEKLTHAARETEREDFNEMEQGKKHKKHHF